MLQKLGKNLLEYLKTDFNKIYSDKCIEEGYIKKNSINIIKEGLSYGVLRNNNICINVLFECLICNIIGKQKINCIVKNITKAGIKAEYDSDEKTPIVVFIAREYMKKKHFLLKEGSKIKVEVIASRFEINDKFISVIANITN